MDAAQTDVDDDVVPEPDACATQTEVVDSSPSKELVSIIQSSAREWAKPNVATTMAPVPELEQLRRQTSVCSPPSVGLRYQKLAQQTRTPQVHVCEFFLNKIYGSILRKVCLHGCQSAVTARKTK